jgi:hypothetical protein
VSTVDVVSLCAFPAGAILWEAQPNQLSLTVIVKATFALVPGDVTVAPEQEPLREERHWDDNGLASLHGPGDFAPAKRRVDVTLVGHAYAPRGEPVTEIVARLAVGDLVKAVRVTGDRAWTLDANELFEPGPPSPFRQMPLRYERAALSADNPIGIDVDGPPVPAMPALPTLERGEREPRGEATPCFGPVATTWRARRRLLDEAATFWAYGIAHDPRGGAPPLGPAPPRFDFAFFNAAPADQQLELLRPGTPIALDHLHPEHARLETRLPAIRPQVYRVPPPDTPRARVEEIVLRCDSLWIDTDRNVAVMTWRGLADVGRGANGVGRVIVAADPHGKKLRWEHVEKRLGEHDAPTLRLGPDSQSPAEEQDEGPPPDPLARRHDAVKGQPVEGPTASDPLLDSNTQDAPTDATDRRRDDERTQALPELSRRPSSSKREPTDSPKPPVALTSRPPGARPILVMGAQLGVPRPSAPPSVPAPRAPRPAGAGVPASRSAGPALRRDLTVQRYAEIAAALAQKGANRLAVLRAHLLTEPAWTMVDQHWTKVMAGEAAQGGQALAEAFDDAYVTAQDRLRPPRPPIDVAAYARLQVGLERGEVGRVLADLQLELGDLVRLQRVWARRVAASDALGAELARALEGARGNAF